MKKNSSGNVQNGVCKLCEGSKHLCRSHVIPEFAFSALYDSEHRFIEVVDVVNGTVRKAQKGYWDRLLCEVCEARMNEFEKHSCVFFSNPLPPHIENSRRIREFPDVSYEKLKLLVLSILWRASVSKLQFFEHVSLGPHEEKIRQMLLSQSPGGAEEYGVMTWALHLEGEHLKDFLVEPTYQRYDGRKCYRIVASGFLFYVFVCSHRPAEKTRIRLLSPSAPVSSVDMEIREISFLREVWNLSGVTTKDSKIELKKK